MVATSMHKFQIVIQLLFHFSCKDIAQVTAALSSILFAYTPTYGYTNIYVAGGAQGGFTDCIPLLTQNLPF